VDAKISRAEALGEAMVSMIDGKGYKNGDGKTLFTYAHPLFWAPYTIIGVGGTIDRAFLALGKYDSFLKRTVLDRLQTGHATLLISCRPISSFR
jgi:hypothetical protein